jgi:hypothetical protein
MTDVKTINVETMLLGWKETHNGGAEIRLQLSCPEDLEQFKLMTIKKGKTAGQILMAVFVEMHDGVTPERKAPESHVGPLAKWAVMRCKEESFQKWMSSIHDLKFWLDGPNPEEACKRIICVLCKIESRKQLDTNPEAARLFDLHIRNPYAEKFGEL